MVEILASIIGALAAGALAKASEIGGRAAVDAYDGLKALIVRKLGKSGAVQSVEDEPRSEPAQSALADALSKAGLAADPELAQHAKALRTAVDTAAGTSGAAIEVGNIFGQVNVLVSDLVATGRIKLGDIRAEKGDVKFTNITAGAAAAKKSLSGGEAGNAPLAARQDSPASSGIPWVALGNIRAGGDVHFTLTQERAAAHRIVDIALSEIGLFLHRDLVRSLSGTNGVLEPNRDWKVLLENAAAIRSTYPSLSQDQTHILERTLDSLEGNLNRVVSILRDAAARGLGGTETEQQVVRQLNIVIAESIRNFQSSITSYRTAQNS